MTTSARLRLPAVAAAAAGVVLLSAVPASAHVGVDSPDAAPGEFGKLVFRVPNESDAADTTKLRVRLPADTPLAFVSTGTEPGWSVQTTTEKLDEPVETDGFTLTEAVTTITWTAEKGAGIPPEQFTEFEVSGGPFPTGVDSMTFPVTQTYSDGAVAAWDDVTREGKPEPEHPAPVLELAGADESATTSAAASNTTSPESDDAAPAAATQAEATSDTTARMLGGLAVLLAAAALVRSLLTGRRARS